MKRGAENLLQYASWIVLYYYLVLMRIQNYFRNNTRVKLQTRLA